MRGAGGDDIGTIGCRLLPPGLRLPHFMLGCDGHLLKEPISLVLCSLSAAPTAVSGEEATPQGSL